MSRCLELGDLFILGLLNRKPNDFLNFSGDTKGEDGGVVAEGWRNIWRRRGLLLMLLFFQPKTEFVYVFVYLCIVVDDDAAVVDAAAVVVYNDDNVIRASTNCFHS